MTGEAPATTLGQMQTEECLQRWQKGFIPRLAFPDHVHGPALCSEFRRDSAIPGNVGVEFFLPEGITCLWRRRGGTARMSMPEAAMYKHDGSTRWEHYIRRAGQPTPMEAEP